MHEFSCIIYRVSVDETPRDEVADLGAAKALANQLRQRILRELELLGEATSTTLAARLGVSPMAESSEAPSGAETAPTTTIPVAMPTLTDNLCPLAGVRRSMA